jgi:hypothetical protein
MAGDVARHRMLTGASLVALILLSVACDRSRTTSGVREGAGPKKLVPAELVTESAAVASARIEPAAIGAPVPTASPAKIPHRPPLVLTDAQRGNGFYECILPDPGNGFYDPIHQMPLGWIAVPREGGHTDDLGFDVLIHFHGFPSVRKTIVQEAKGVVLAGFDLGNGAEAYASKASPYVFQTIKENVTTELRRHAKNPKAHIRHLAITAWSAGYAAVNAILRGGDEGIDAVVLLDGFHTAYVDPKRPDDLDAMDVNGVAPLLSFAARAAAGEKIFFFTHSQVGTHRYASTTKLANLLVSRLSLSPTAGPPTEDPFGLTDFVDKNGFHMRGYGGVNEKAHCDQVRHIGEAVREFLEPAWGTPAAVVAANDPK